MSKKMQADLQSEVISGFEGENLDGGSFREMEDYAGTAAGPVNGRNRLDNGAGQLTHEDDLEGSVGNDSETATTSSEAHRRTVGEPEFATRQERSSSAATKPKELDESLWLDAWYSSFTSPVSQALARTSRVRREEFLPEVIIGPDDRVKVANTTTFPWRAICSLKITAADGTNWIGTGWFCGPRLVMTAGHCVHMASNGGWVKQIEVIPGRNGASQPYGSRVSKTFRSTNGWVQSQNRNYDYAAIYIAGGTALGNTVGYFGYGTRSDSELMSYLVNVSGYPGDKPTGTQWWHSKGVKSVSPFTFVYDIDTMGGQSGAPVWVLSNNQRIAVGIHTNGAPTGNSATRIQQQVFNNITTWRTESGS